MFLSASLLALFGAGCQFTAGTKGNAQTRQTATSTTPDKIGIAEVTSADEPKITALIQNDPQIKQLVSQTLLKKPFIFAFDDVTKSKKNQAIVMIPSTGTAGNLYAIIVGRLNGSLTILGRVLGTHLQASSQEGDLLIQQPRYSPTDPNCCPSSVVKTIYRWNGNAFQKISQNETKL